MKSELLALGIEEGTIFCDTWGYEQTNVDFYKVTKLIGKSSVELVKVANRVVEENGYCNQMVVAERNKEVSQPIRKLVHKQSKTIKLKSYSYASIWKGKPVNQTSYY